MNPELVLSVRGFLFSFYSELFSPNSFPFGVSARECPGYAFQFHLRCGNDPLCFRAAFAGNTAVLLIHEFLGKVSFRAGELKHPLHSSDSSWRTLKVAS